MEGPQQNRSKKQPGCRSSSRKKEAVDNPMYPNGETYTWYNINMYVRVEHRKIGPAQEDLNVATATKSDKMR